jgi:hypothetical protein
MTVAAAPADHGWWGCGCLSHLDVEQQVPQLLLQASCLHAVLTCCLALLLPYLACLRQQLQLLWKHLFAAPADGAAAGCAPALAGELLLKEKRQSRNKGQSQQRQTQHVSMLTIATVWCACTWLLCNPILHTHCSTAHTNLCMHDVLSKLALP